MEIVDKLLSILEEKHGEKLNIKDNVYYLFLKGGLFSVYYSEDEKTIKVDVEFLPEENTFIYFSDEELNKLMGV